MSSGRDEQVLTAREMDRMSTALIDVGIRLVKQNPIPVGMYFIGILICLIFNGFSVTDTQRYQYENKLQETRDISEKLYALQSDVYMREQDYYRSRGWFFSCDQTCHERKSDYEWSKGQLKLAVEVEQNIIGEAKSAVGLFSTYGVSETRELFWTRFNQGKAFAKRQTMWDALFIGIGAMGRDEKFMSYVARVALNLLLNFTLGVFGAVVAFIFGLYSLIQSYQASFLTGMTFFMFAALSACAFAMTWLIGLYLAAAGTAYVGLKAVASNLRLQQGGGGGQRGRVRYE